MNRRQVLVRMGTLLLAVPASRLLIACEPGVPGGRDAGGRGTDEGGGGTPYDDEGGGPDDDGQEAGGPDAGQAGETDAGPQDGGGDAGTDGGLPPALTFTSSVAGSHTHTFTLQPGEVDSPPTGGLRRETTFDSGHLHLVTLSEAELDTLAAGGTVTKESSVDFSHSHTFTFQRS